MSNVLVPIANGSEDIEAITIIDVLRRGGVDVTVASVHEVKSITGANGCKIEADVLLTDVADVQYMRLFFQAVCRGLSICVTAHC